MEVLGSRGILRAPLLLVLGALLHLLLLALAGGAEAWAHPGGFAGGERRYRDLAAGRMASVRSSFGAPTPTPRRGLATVSTLPPFGLISLLLISCFQIKMRDGGGGGIM